MTRYYLMIIGVFLMAILSAETHITYWISQFGAYPVINGGSGFIRTISLVNAAITSVICCILEFALTRFFGKPRISSGLYFWLSLGVAADFYWSSFHLMPLIFREFDMDRQMHLWHFISVAIVVVMQLITLRTRNRAEN